MPPHIAIYDEGTNDLADPIAISISGGEESAVSTLDFWNDKNDDFVDTTTAQDQVLKVLASSSGGPYVSSGVPLLDERWSRARITHTLTAAGASTDGAGGTLPVGTNSEFPLPDLEPQTGVRIEFYVAAPAGSTADAVKIKLQPVGNQASVPLAQFVGLASGSGVIPGDRVAGLRAILRGSVVVADDSDTVAVGRGLMVYDGITIATMAEDVVVDLADGDAVNLGAAEAYNVTLSRSSAGVLTETRGPKAEAVAYPALPAGHVLVAYLTVESADGIAVTVAPASVDQSFAYHEFSVTAGAGLAVTVGPGDGLTDTGFRQPSTHSTSVSLDASVTSRIWRLAAGSKVATLTDVPPEVGADLLAWVTTDGSGVTTIVDARRFVHRALVYDRIELSYSAALSQVTVPAHALAWAVVPFDCEVESVELEIRATDGTWTAGALQIDVQTVAAGATVAAGTTIFTSSATDDARPSIAWNATVLRATSENHEVRRLSKGMRVLLSLITTVAAPGAEPAQEIRAALVVRRYR